MKLTGFKCKLCEAKTSTTAKEVYRMKICRKCQKDILVMIGENKWKTKKTKQ